MNWLRYNIGDDVCAFSTMRQPGTSTGNYAGFNITHYCGDNPQHVKANRTALCQELGITDACLLLPRQTHGTDILKVDDAFLKLSHEERQLEMDGIDVLVTDIPRICIGVSTADCIPILLYDEKNRAIAAIHAGWRGTVADIATKAVVTMQQTFNTEPGGLKAVIGPGISMEAFEVGNEVYSAFEKTGLPMEQIAAPMNGKWHINLWAANYLQLERCGLGIDNIQVAGICTYMNSESFFSARRLGIESGRIYNGIMLTQ